MKEVGMLFKPEMVAAILSGQKTQTRRNITVSKDWKPSPPRVSVGDVIWVRETFYAFGYWEKNATTNHKWHFVDMSERSDRGYKYEDSKPQTIGKRDKWGKTGWFKRPALFMPRAASRITLKVTDVYGEILDTISESDAIAEGIQRGEDHLSCLFLDYQGSKTYSAGAYALNRTSWVGAVTSYKSLWENINGPGSFDDRLVRVIKFERI